MKLSVKHDDTGFYVAPFGPDGELIDVGFWRFRDLSTEWLRVCEAFLVAFTESNKASWGGALAHIQTRITARSGAALVTFYVNDEVTLSAAYLSGSNVDIDAEVIRLFVESLRKTAIVRLASIGSTLAFESALSLSQRPLAVFVIWHPDSVSDTDMDLVRELSLHLAGAFFDY